MGVRVASRGDDQARMTAHQSCAGKVGSTVVWFWAGQSSGCPNPQPSSVAIPPPDERRPRISSQIKFASSSGWISGERMADDPAVAAASSAAGKAQQ